MEPAAHRPRPGRPGQHRTVRIIAGARDPAVPPVNAEFLHHRLPRSKLDVLDAGHFTWEDAADQYAGLVITWWTGGYTATSQESQPPAPFGT
jgi:pimeloyl-ACP methyl ester carboxylesterase